MNLTRNTRPIFARAIDSDTRAFCIKQCKIEIERSQKLYDLSPHEFNVSYAAAVRKTERVVGFVEAFPFISHRFLGIDKCWLEILGFRFSREHRLYLGGLDAVCNAAEECLDLRPGTVIQWSIDDLFRIYRGTKLTEYWLDTHIIKEFPKRAA